MGDSGGGLGSSGQGPIGGGGGGGGPPAGAGPSPSGSTSTSDTDESTWRGRALQAEDKIKELEQSLVTLRAELEAGKRTLEAMIQRREVERQLIDAKAQDVETALLLVEQTLAKGADKDVGRVVAEVKQRKPHLFEAARAGGAVAMGGVPREAGYETAVERAFEKARGSGGTRRSLLEYLRAKRG